MQTNMKTSLPWKTTLLTGLLTLLTAGASFAQQMNYQGRLTDGAGGPVPDTQYSITFDIFDSATGTNKKWGPQVIPADTVQGRFNVILGPTDTASRSIVSAFDGGTRYLQITFQGNPILPRQQILNAPTAFFAETAGQLANVFVRNGRLGVGTTNPIAGLEVVVGPGVQTGGMISAGAANGHRVSIDVDDIQRYGSYGSTPNTLYLNDYGGNVDIGSANATTRIQGNLSVETTAGTTTLAGNLNVSSSAATTTIAGNTTIAKNAAIGGGAVHADNTLRLWDSIGYNVSAIGTDMMHEAQLEIRNPAQGSGNRSMALGVTDFGHGVIQVKEQGVGNESVAAGGGYQGLLLQPFAGRVGIGINDSPTKGKLEIAGSAENQAYTGFAILTTSQSGGSQAFTGTSSSAPNSIYASGRVVGTDFIAFSDKRIKRVAGQSDAVQDLATLRGIQVTDYTYIDTVSKGTGQHKKVIAQQVEKVFPQAVNRSTDEVPDIFRMAVIKDGWLQLKTNLKKGERVCLIAGKQDGIHEVLEVADGKFRTDFKPESEKVFVYGREVKDFRNVDYEAIAMLNVSATQELARQVEALKKSEARVAQLEREMSELKKLVTQLATTGKTPEQTAHTSTPGTTLVTASLSR